MIEYGIVGLLILVAVIHLLRTIIRSARGADGGCGAGCGCHGASKAMPERLGKRIDLVQLGTSPDRNHKRAT